MSFVLAFLLLVGAAPAQTVPENPFTSPADLARGERRGARMRKLWVIASICSLSFATDGAQSVDVTFHKDVAPILEARCQGCHRPGEVAPMSLLTYQDARPYAKAIRAAVLQKTMPPWFAEPGIGHFANDRTLPQSEIDVLVRWADSGAREGDPNDARKPLRFTEGWRIGVPDVIFELPKPFDVPSTGTVPYQYIRVPTGFTEDKWVEAVEVQAGDRSVVHHINVYTSLPSEAAKGQRTGEFFTFTADEARPRGEDPPQFSNAATWEMLEVHVPGGVTPVPEARTGPPHQGWLGDRIPAALHAERQAGPGSVASRADLR